MSVQNSFKLKHFFQLIRINNLLILAFVQILFWLVFNTNHTKFIALILLIQATVFLAASGNIINDFFDVEADKINKPHKVLINKYISKKTALSLYFVLTLFGILSGLILSYLQHKIWYGLLFIVISILLFLYSKSLKKIALLGNFIVSALTSASILLVYVFLMDTTKNHLKIIFLSYALFAFLLNFIREITKDIEDIDGDYKQNRQTLPILIGKVRTKNVVFYFTFIPFILVILFTSSLQNYYLLVYAIVFIVLPLGYFMYQIKEVKTKKKLHQLSVLLKIIMLFGILSAVFF